MVASLTRHELTGVVILKNGTILSGHRRVEAAKAAGIIECDCIVRTDLKNEWDELEALLDYNRQREKSNEQRAREYDAYLEVERQRARERQIETLKQNARNLDSVPKNFSEREKGESRQIASSKVNLPILNVGQYGSVSDEWQNLEVSETYSWFVFRVLIEKISTTFLN